MNLYVGNLSLETRENQLQSVFESFGQVESVTIIRDKFSGDSRGFGFVEMPNHTEALAAISGLAGQEVDDRTITVSEARPRNNAGQSGRSGGHGRGGHRSW